MEQFSSQNAISSIRFVIIVTSTAQCLEHTSMCYLHQQAKISWYENNQVPFITLHATNPLPTAQYTVETRYSALSRPLANAVYPYGS